MSEPVTEITGDWDARIRLFRSEDVDCFVVTTDRFVVVMDTMITTDEATEMLTAIQPSLEHRALLTVNTHQHTDHTWGNAVFESLGPIIGHEKSLEIARSQEALEKLRAAQTKDAKYANVRIVPPTLTFTDRFTIHGGDLTLELIPAPGHSLDHVVVWIPELRTLLAADAAEHPWPYAKNPQDLPVLLETLRNLQMLNPSVVLPCHGGTSDPGLISRNLTYYATLEDHAKRALELGTLPENWLELEDLPERIGWTFEDAARSIGLEPDGIAAFYKDFHVLNARATLIGLGAKTTA
jgi:glyoxylase-like metal-dependent hydrolase (beta-lactamase superfamily II)